LYANTFERNRVLHLENVQTDINTFADAPILTFSNLINKYQGQITDFQAMQPSMALGLIRIDTTVFKDTILPSPRRCKSDIESLLPQVAREKCAELLTELKDANNRISAIPATVEEFVEIMAFLSQVQDRRSHTQDRFLFIEQMYGLMAEHTIKVVTEDRDNFDRLTQARSAFKTSFNLSHASIDNNTERFSRELQAEIPKLQANVEKLMTALGNPMISSEDADAEEVISFLEDRDQQLSILEEKAQRFQYYQEVLQVEVVEYPNLRETRLDMDVKLSLWASLKSWAEQTANWMTTKFAEIDVEEINRQVTIYNKVYSQAKRMLSDSPVVPLLRRRVAEFQNTLPVVSDLRNEHLLLRHWEEINVLLGHDIKNDEDFTLGTLIDLNAMEHKQAINVISVKANQEALLQEQLNKVMETWADLNFPVIPYKDAKDVYILDKLDDVTAALDETMVMMNTIMGSRYVDPIRDEVGDWNNKLNVFSETLDEWMNCQRQWMYLENIFSAQDIVRQLPEESKVFSGIDKAWKEIMRRTNDQPNALRAGTYLGLRDNLISYNATLDRVQKQLEQYLETKRQQFPRFYFLSNDELLEILAQSKSVDAIQPHLRKCFDNIMRLEFDDRDIKAMISSEGERVPLGVNLKARGSVEVWLGLLEADMVKTLRRRLKAATVAYDDMDRTEWVLDMRGQMVMTGSQIHWCRQCESAISAPNSNERLSLLVERQVKQLTDLTAMVRGQLSKTDRKKLVALVTTDVHARDITEQLRDSDVSHMNNFTWQQQLRFYWDTEEDDCLVRQSNALFKYGYEYMGVTSRLVITPLTDRCWMTITGALHIRFGASPAGPAGTGKTESTKDLAKAMGLLCVVFNCSDQIDYKMMGKLFSGLAQTGAWTCLDEFNRIDIEVLSVVAQQLMTVRHALLADSEQFQFMDQRIPLKKTFGVMVTMNPGYAGRTELPDNLKVLFRPVSMMIPDYALIAEIMLFAEGFDSAHVLSTKMVKLYKLASEQLSQQDHYDFGMRAVKSVLVMAGALKRAEPDLTEDVVLIRAMCDSNLPKFVKTDLPLFDALVQDLFPGVAPPVVDYIELKDAIRKCIEHSGLQYLDSFVQKVVQLFETFNVRFGVMIVGPTGGGKSSCHSILAQAMTLLRTNNSDDERYQTVFSHVLNPKCITMGELYGEVNIMTQEWTDGLASTIMREAIKDESEDKHWVVFDGPVDALWIENMNTVLDDNMTLCLVNGERIKLKSTLRMLFEVQDLAVASPATVSRCGMVYMTPEDLGWLPYVQSWLPNFPPALPLEVREFMLNCFTDKLPTSLAFVREHCKEAIPTVDINLVTSLCSLFEALFTTENGVDFDDTIDDLNMLVEMLFAYCMTWSLGGALDSESREKFSKHMLETFVNIRPTGTFFSAFVDVREKVWTPWEAVVPEFNYDSAVPYFQLLVPTVDTVRFARLLETLLSVEKATFFTGLTGVGKTMIAQNLFASLKESKNLIPVNLAFSAQTNALKTQEIIESKLVKLRRSTLGAPPGKKLVIFVDDVNMPAVEEYGAQPPVELLRQFSDYKGFYDRKKLFWKSVTDTTLVCAAAPPGGGRHSLTPRFVRHFNVLCVGAPDEQTMQKIFASILQGFLAQPGFKNVSRLLDPIVKSTIDLYGSISKALLPTPAKSHYTFNLRDISKVFQGVLMAKPLTVPEPEVLIRLWVHEASRCFADRLTNDDDRSWFRRKVVSLLSMHFNTSWTVEDVFESRTILFGDFMAPGVERTYLECPDMRKAEGLLDDYLEEYNMATTTQMKLVFFDDAIEHVARIARIIRQPRGNAMLVGVGGSGKQSLTRLACAMTEFDCLQIEVTRGYGYADFQEHLKKLMIMTGVEGKNVVFLFTENQIISERFLEDINAILNTGEVPNLFPADEMQHVIDQMTPVVKELGLPTSRDVIYATFVERVRDKLHIVMCMSPVGDSFRTRCRMFPSLINCTTIDWYDEWPRDACHSVAVRFLKELDLPSEEVRDALATSCVEIQSDIKRTCADFFTEFRRQVYTTPKSYLDMIQLFLSLLAEKRDELSSKHQRLTTGLKKLYETKNVVSELRETLKKLQPVLVEKARETEALLEQVVVDTSKAEKVKEVVDVERDIVAKQAASVASLQADAQADLDLAMPALRAALKSLEKLDKAAITEVRSMANPPTGVMMTMEAVCILFGVVPDWDTSKRLLNDLGFIKNVKEFDKDNIDPRKIKKLQKYVSHPLFTEEKMLKVSQAATALCVWTRAMVTYFKVAKEVEPKKQKVAEMTVILNEANQKLSEKETQLAAVNAAVTTLREKSEQSSAEKARLDGKSKQTEQRLIRAEKLTSGLAEEQVRWAADAEKIMEQMKLLPGNVFVSAAAVAYFGPFTGDYRNQLVQNWHSMCKSKSIPISDDFSLRSTLGDEVTIRQWTINGLPSNEVNIDNGLLVKHAKRWPLMIDPQGQANNWIKKEFKNNLVVVRFGDKNLLTLLENALREGLPLLVEDVGEHIDAQVDPVLMQNTFLQGNRMMIHLGENDVEYDSRFRFFMTTKLPNPHYMPEVCIKVTLLNFTVTVDGLEDQLLGDVVKKERPDIEAKRNRLVVSMADDRKQLEDIEKRILKMLSESQGNILDDEVLITTLGESKFTSNVIHDRVNETVETQRVIEDVRNGYRPAATRGSLLYFVISDLSLIDPMYQYSLEYFVRVFNHCIEASTPAEDLTTRLGHIMTFMTQQTFKSVCRGLFAVHKLIYSFLITVTILRNQGEITDSEWNMLVREGGGAVARTVDTSTFAENPMPDLVGEKNWRLLSLVSHVVPAFAGLIGDVCGAGASDWLSWIECEAPHEEPLPGQWEEKLSPFQHLLLLKCLRPEKLMFAFRDYVLLKMGETFVETASPALKDVFDDTDCKTPVIFVLSQGADPTSLLFRLAQEMGYTDRLQVISLGQGQGDNAKRLIANAKKNGEWVMLQNCHLSKSWMPELEAEVDALAHPDEDDIMTRTDPNFRLWLTSMPCDYFPVPVLQMGIKLTNEPPKGLRANTMRSYNNVINAEEFDKCTKQGPWQKLLFGVCFFHATIQERKKFGPLGWNKLYEFNDSDLSTSVQVLRMFLDEQDTVPWDALRYVCGHINYGGRVTDDWDRRCLMSILSKFFTPDILDDAYRFDGEGVYYAPAHGDLDSMRAFAASLPPIDKPQIFGMHENANITFQNKETNLILATILSIQPRELLSEGGKSTDDLVAEMAAEIEEHLPPLLVRAAAGETTFVEINGVMDSLGTVLIQEIERFNRLLKQVKSTLVQLQKAIRGEEVMSHELDLMFQSLLNNAVPSLWASVAYPSLKPLAAWVADLHERMHFMQSWLKSGAPSSFWISGFFFPQGFLTGVLQNFARKYRIPIDTLNFSFEVNGEFDKEKIDTPPEDGVYVYGLFMDGARWDPETRVVSNSKLGELFPPVPIIHFKPTENHVADESHYACPVYKTSVRAGVLSTTGQSTNFVLAVELPSNEPPDTWVLRGAALLCQLDY
jgi:dynein heavy chain